MANNSEAYNAFLSNRKANKVPVAAVGQDTANMEVMNTVLSIENLLYSKSSKMGIINNLIIAV